MDTVEPGRGIKPVWDGADIIRSDGTTILGADNKAGCAVILEVIQSAIEDGAETRTIEVAISRGEEIGLVGATKMDYSRISAKVAIVIDSGGPPSSIRARLPITALRHRSPRQKRPRGLEPEKGVPAISSTRDIVGLPRALRQRNHRNVGKVQGGLVRNAVPDTPSSRARCAAWSRKARTLMNTPAARDEVAEAHPDARIDAKFASLTRLLAHPDDRP